MTQALVIDDESQIRRLLRLFLEKQDFAVREAETGAEGISAFAGVKPDIVLLDLGLPDMDGAEVLARIRGRGDTPVIILSVRDSEEDVVSLLNSGADDYLPKPFGTGELLARMRVALRKRAPPSCTGKIRVGTLIVDVENREAFRNDESERLTPTEWGLLLLFLRNEGKIMTHRQILREIWGPSMEEEYNNLRVYVNQLRKKIEVDPAMPMVLLTEPGVGYRIKI